MNSLRSRTALGGQNATSLSRLDSATTKMNSLVSPTRPSSNVSNGLSDNNRSALLSSTKQLSISVKPNDKKSTTSLASLKAGGASTSINLSSANLLESKKPSEQQQLIGDFNSISNNNTIQLQQSPMDISQINNDSKVDVSHIQSNLPMTTSLARLNQNGGQNANMTTSTMNKKPLISGQAINTSFTGMSKSPLKKTDLLLNGNLIQSVNLGNANMLASTNQGGVFGQNGSMNNNNNNNINDAANQSMLNQEPALNFEILKQFDQKQKSSNIKTFIRVRPLNKMEVEFNENGCGSENLRYPDAKSVMVMPEKAVFNLDRVYPPDSKQDEIYENVGREMVNDVLQGYNGTIFAYGPTGSGKTFTMFGDVHDEQKKGIIPRVSNQIFAHISSVSEDQDVEFIISCSMLEIYKENLFDLLKVDRVGLKIKENPQKGGIYVQGLTTISVDCEEEIIDVINLGYSSKQTRETRMNEYSSRSHTIFTINVTQRYANGQEKIGKLNLVDLAGSEKIAKTNATGETLEEAKKINLSLSCLGNVIHALTSNQEHIPYRDSKLTRILQESLGGNYKTSLIAAISPHSSQHEEQTSTLKFATRAKTIKNQVKMNVKLSVEQMRKLIEQLKAELEKAKGQNTRFRGIIKKLRDELKANTASILSMSKDGKVSEQQQQAMQNMRALEDILNVSDLDPLMEEDNNSKGDSLPKSGSKVLDEDSYSEENNNNNQANDGTGASNNASGVGVNGSQLQLSSNKRNASYSKQSANQLNASPISASASGKGVNLDYKSAYLEKASQCRNLEKDLMEMKKNLLEVERRLGDMREEKHRVEVNHTQQVTKNDFNQFQNEILQKQVQSLVDSICKQENSIGSLMKEKQELSQKKIDEFLKEKLNFSEIHFSEYFKNSINFNYDNLVQKWSEVQKNMKSIGIDDDELVQQSQHLEFPSGSKQSNKQMSTQRRQLEELARGSFMGNLDFNAVSKPYDMLEGIVEFPGQLERFHAQHPISRDLMIILLKKQLFNSHIINQHLARTINALEWKQIIEYGKAKMKSVLNAIQATHISNLEQVINEASENYRNLRNRIETVELETQFVKERFDSHSESAPRKSKIVKDTESIRHLLMKPSNDSIRQSLRGSYIGFQLDVDKTLESPIMKELKDTDELLQKEFMPLTYDRAIEELKSRNALVRRAYTEFKGNMFNGLSQEFLEQVLKEKERLEGKITSLQNELKMEIGKSEHYADAYKGEKQTLEMQKEQTKELEQFLVTKMKEESEQMERTQKKISDQHESEILKYQQSFSRIQEKFADYIRLSLGRVSELKAASGGSVQANQLEQVLQEMQAMKEQYNRMFNIDDYEYGNLQQSQTTPRNGSIAGTPQVNGGKLNQNSMLFKSFESIAGAQMDNQTNSLKHSAMFAGGMYNGGNGTYGNSLVGSQQAIRIDEDQNMKQNFHVQVIVPQSKPTASMQAGANSSSVTPVVGSQRSRYDTLNYLSNQKDQVNEQQQQQTSGQTVVNNQKVNAVSPQKSSTKAGYLSVSQYNIQKDMSQRYNSSSGAAGSKRNDSGSSLGASSGPVGFTSVRTTTPNRNASSKAMGSSAINGVSSTQPTLYQPGGQSSSQASLRSHLKSPTGHTGSGNQTYNSSNQGVNQFSQQLNQSQVPAATISKPVNSTLFGFRKY